jgi:hypothetical protein
MCLRLEPGNFSIAPSVFMLYLKDYTNTCCYLALYVSTMFPKLGPTHQFRDVFFLNKFCLEKYVIFFYPRF